MNPEASSPTLADDEPVTSVARKVGPPVAAASLLLTFALLAWLALAPTAIAGPLTEAPFIVPATLVVGPDDDGCVDVVTGDGDTAASHCFDEFTANEDEEYVYVESWFDEDGNIQLWRDGEEGAAALTIDAGTGEVLARDTFDSGPGAPEREELRTPPPPGDDGNDRTQVYADGDVVRRFGDGVPRPGGKEDPVVLDLDAPPGYQLRDAVLSPDGAWVVVTTPDDHVVVAPTDGSAAPYVWADVPEDRWVSLWSAIRWDG